MTETLMLTYEALPDAKPAPAQGETPKFIELPKPDPNAGVPLMTALSVRASPNFDFSSSRNPRQRWVSAFF